MHQIYAHGSEFAAHAALWSPEEEKGVGTPRGQSGTGLLSAAAVQDELRQVLLRVTERAGDAWNEEDREECRVNFEIIAKDAESSETGVSDKLGSAVTAVLERLLDIRPSRGMSHPALQRQRRPPMVWLS